MIKKDDSIAVFDSGLGGLSVLKRLRAIMPSENYIYYGDSANAPYGQKSSEEIQNCCGGVVKKLIDKGVKCVVIACNTATGAALSYLKENFPDTEFMGIQPAVAAAAHSLPCPLVLTLATNFTINSEMYKSSVEKLKGKGRFIGIGAPELVLNVEKGISDKNVTEECISYIDSLLSGINEPVDAVVLGCTHFPFLGETIKKETEKLTGGKAVLFDAAVITAQNTFDWLSENGLLNEQKNEGSVTLMNSDPSKIPVMEKLIQ